jgi:hypothetical protein
LDPELAGPSAFDTRAERHDDVEEDVYVANPRDIAQLARLIGEHARRDQRQRGVLVSFDGNTPRQRAASFDSQ